MRNDTTHNEGEFAQKLAEEARAWDLLEAHDNGCAQCSTLSTRGRCGTGRELWFAYMKAGPTAAELRAAIAAATLSPE